MQTGPTGKTTIPCVLTSGSLNSKDYVFVRLFLPAAGRNAWVPRQCVKITEQHLKGSELQGKLLVDVYEEMEDKLIVEISNRGVKERLMIPKSLVSV